MGNIKTGADMQLQALYDVAEVFDPIPADRNEWTDGGLMGSVRHGPHGPPNSSGLLNLDSGRHVETT
jgi:hypothetical protein